MIGIRSSAAARRIEVCGYCSPTAFRQPAVLASIARPAFSAISRIGRNRRTGSYASGDNPWIFTRSRCARQSI